MERLKHKKEECYGCGACVSLCPLELVEMKQDEEGFFYAVYDENKCINCGKCLKACPAFDKLEDTQKREIYAIRHKDEKELKKSTSGAAFFLLAEAVIEQGGAVVGVQFDEQFHVIHRIAENTEELSAMRGSKYVQSNMVENSIYEQVLKRLQVQKVLFTGTPCQADALRRYVKVNRGMMENLILCDLICGRATSPGVWEDYKGYLEQACQGKLESFSFRDKRYGWNYHGSSATVSGKDCSEYITFHCNWNELFNNPAFKRPVCYQCPFTRVSRNVDLTIGDFWGIEKISKKFSDNKGVNVIIAHTDMGKKLLHQICEISEYFVSNEEECVQWPLKEPGNCPENRAVFWDTYRNGSMDEFMQRYGQRTFVKNAIYRWVIPVSRRIGLYDSLWKITHRNGHE